jgi:DNA-binding CsgD family transcriptional regulator
MALHQLTPREKEIVELIVAEKSTHEISDLLCISQKTVETHRKNIYLKLGVKNLVGLVKIAIQNQTT